MREDRTLRRSLFIFTVAGLLVPLLLLSVLNQVRSWKILHDNLTEDMGTEADTVNQMIDMVMSKYDAVLYDFCTDDDTIGLVEQINAERDVLDVNSNQLRRQLSHIVNRNEGVEGITLETDTGKIFFYDRNASSSMDSTWAGEVKTPEVTRGSVYRGGVAADLGEGRYGHFLQIARRIVDYRDINRQIGTVILSVDQDVLWDVIQMKKSSRLYLCEEGRIIAARDSGWIRRDISKVDSRGYEVLSRVNDKTGWTLYDFYSVKEYNQAAVTRVTFEILTMAAVVIFVLYLMYFVTTPILNQVSGLMECMNRVEQGDFTVQARGGGSMPKEVARIVDGFNTMVRRLGELMEQVRRSTVEQKNAELSAMEAQIDPHFLYNTLDTINWKAIEKEEYEISGMLGALADILRYSIRNPGDTVSIGQELYWLSQYTTLQKERLERPLEVSVDVPDKIKEYRIHKLLLQPFVENAIKHGMDKTEGTCLLEIRMRLTDGQIYITIRDNGSGIPKEVLDQLNDKDSNPGDHIGIANVRKRLQLYYEDDAAFYFESEEGVGTTVHLFVKAIGGEDVTT